MNDVEKAQKACDDADAAVAVAEGQEQAAYDDMKRNGDGNPRSRLAWLNAASQLSKAYAAVSPAYAALAAAQKAAAPAPSAA